MSRAEAVAAMFVSAWAYALTGEPELFAWTLARATRMAFGRAIASQLS